MVQGMDQSFGKRQSETKREREREDRDKERREKKATQNFNKKFVEETISVSYLSRMIYKHRNLSVLHNFYLTKFF